MLFTVFKIFLDQKIPDIFLISKIFFRTHVHRIQSTQHTPNRLMLMIKADNSDIYCLNSLQKQNKHIKIVPCFLDVFALYTVVT